MSEKSFDQRSDDQQEEMSSEELSLYEDLLGTIVDGVRADAENEHLFDDWSEIGNYQICNLLGIGGQAHCFRAFDSDLQRTVVIKAYRPELSQQYKTRVLQEGRALARIDSPHVARCYTVDQHGQSPFLVLEYIKGLTLSRWALGQQITCAQASDLIDQLLLAVESIHQVGLLHLDLKPGNVVVDENDRIKLIDFGMSQNRNTNPESSPGGSPAFVAPERLAGNEPDERSDIYGVGCVLFFLLTRSAPATGDSRDLLLQKALKGDLNWPALESSNANRNVVRFCKKCLQLDPEARFQSAAEARSVLQSQKKQRDVARMAMVAVAGLIVLGLALWWGSGRDSKANPQPTARESIHHAIENGDYKTAVRLEKSLRQQSAPLDRKGLKSVDRTIRWAELAGDFADAAIQHQTCINFLKSRAPVDNYEVQFRQKMKESCESIAAMPKDRQEDIRRGLQDAYHADMVRHFRHSESLEYYESAYDRLKVHLPEDSIRFAIIVPKMVLAKDRFNFLAWESLDVPRQLLAGAKATWHKHLGDHPRTAFLTHQLADHFGYTGEIPSMVSSMKLHRDELRELYPEEDPQDQGQIPHAEFWFAFSKIYSPRTAPDVVSVEVEKLCAFVNELEQEQEFDFLELADAVNALTLRGSTTDPPAFLARCQRYIDSLKSMVSNYDDLNFDQPPVDALKVRLAECTLAWAIANISAGNNPEKSLERFEQVYRMKSLEPLAHMTMLRQWARALCQLKRIEQARRKCDEAIADYTRRFGEDGIYLPTLEWIYGDLENAMGDPQKRIDIWKEVLEKADNRGLDYPMLRSMKREYQRALEQLKQSEDQKNHPEN